MTEDQFSSILYKVSEEEWEFEAYDISYEIICRFISNLKGFKHDFHFRTKEEMDLEAIKTADSLYPQTIQKLIGAIKLHTEALKFCKKELGRLRRIIRMVVCLSPKLHNTIVAGEDMLSVPHHILINISVFEKFVSWYNKYQQHEATISKLRKLLDTFEPVMEPPDAQTPIPAREGSDAIKEEHPKKTQTKKTKVISRKQANALYEKYKRFFLNKYKERMKETNEKYGATKYAAEETVKEIYKESGSKLSLAI